MPMDFWKTKDVPLEELMPLISDQLEKGNAVRLTPQGTSMLPLLRPGQDSVLLRSPAKELRKFDIVLYQRDSGQFVLHRLVKTGDTYTALGDHQITPESGIRREQILAVVAAFYRGGRRYLPRGLAYGAYCRIWYAFRCMYRFCRKPGWIRRHS